jgi:hypothetical protein
MQYRLGLESSKILNVCSRREDISTIPLNFYAIFRQGYDKKVPNQLIRI